MILAPVWQMPETMTDRLHVYRFVPSMGGGVFQDRTLFKGIFELFSFTATGDAITFTLHETHDKVTSAYTIEKVSGPEPFDLKLTIADDPRGPARTAHGARRTRVPAGRTAMAPRTPSREGLPYPSRAPARERRRSLRDS